MNLQTQLSSLKEQAAQNFGNGCGSTTSFTSTGNPNDHMSSSSSYGNLKIPCNYTQDGDQRWSNSENASMMPEFDDLNISHVKNDYCENGYMMNTESSANYEHLQEPNNESNIPANLEGGCNYNYNYNYSVDIPVYGDHMQTSNQQWCFREDIDDLQSVAFGYVQY